MIGQSIGGYEIVAKLGEGGMGAVYLGEHRRIARKAAIKVLLSDLSDSPEMVGRFFNEARATSMIRHPGIVEILDCDVLPDGNAFIVMEYVEGESLGSALAREGRLPVRRALSLARHVADALAAAHERGIVHRDLKPDNLFLPAPVPGAPPALVAGAPPGQPIKILDFGIAKLMGGQPVGGVYKTHTGRVLGTPAYMSPEQCRGAREIDHRVDVYALACILFEMLCGQPPFAAPGFGQLIYAHLQTTPPPVSSFDAAISPALDDLVARMLAKSPDDRPQNMHAVVVEIDRLAEQMGARLTGAKPVAKTPVTIAAFSGPRIPTPAPVVTPAPVSAPAAVRTPTPATMRTPTPAAMRAPTPAAARGPALPSATPTAVAEASQRSPFAAEPSKVQTTFGSSAAEKLSGLDEVPDEPLGRPGAHRGAWAAAVLALVVVAAVGLWRRLPSSHGGVAATAAAPVAAVPAPIAPPAPAAVAPAPPVAAAVPPEPAPPAAAAVAATPAPVAPPTRAAAGMSSRPSTVKIVIASDPPGAEICLARDGILLGRTSYEWTSERSGRVAKFRLWKEGYRAEELSLVPQHDARKRVVLRKVGTDDIEDLESCHAP